MSTLDRTAQDRTLSGHQTATKRLRPNGYVQRGTSATLLSDRDTKNRLTRYFMVGMGRFELPTPCFQSIGGLAF